MFSIWRVVATCVVLILSLNSAFAASWVANQVRQPAKFTVDGNNWVTIQRGTVMPSSSWIHTGKGGRLLLNRGKETIQFKPNTMAAIAKRNKSGTKTLVRQQFGSLLLDVETRKHKHLKVETPFLAAVVKGTQFTVDVGARAGKLTVHRGVVEVTDQRRGERSNVRSNQSVEISNNSNTRMQVVGAGPKARVKSVKRSKPRLQAVARPGGRKNANKRVAVANTNLTKKNRGFKTEKLGNKKPNFFERLRIKSAKRKNKNRNKNRKNNSDFDHGFSSENSVSNNVNSANASSGNSNAGGNSGNSNAGSGNNNAGGNSGNSNAGSGNNNAGGNSDNSNAGSGNNNAGGNSGNSNAGNGNNNAGGNSTAAAASSDAGGGDPSSGGSTSAAASSDGASGASGSTSGDSTSGGDDAEVEEEEDDKHAGHKHAEDDDEEEEDDKHAGHKHAEDDDDDDDDD